MGVCDVSKERFTTNLKINPEQKINLQVMATLENLSVVDYTLALHKSMLERLKEEVEGLGDKVLSEDGEELVKGVNIKRYGFKSVYELTQSVMALLKNRKELIDKIPDVNQKDEFEVVVLKALHEIQQKPRAFQRDVMPDVMYREGKFESVGEPILEEKKERKKVEMPTQFVV